VLLLDESGEEVNEPNIEGELYVIGGAVASGYWNDPERTAKAFVQHPLLKERRQIVYKTGDRMVYDERGDLVFRGRMDSAIKCRGFRVELGEIEAVAGNVEGVDTACVVPVAHEELSNLLVMFVVAERGKTVDENALRERLAAKLPRYMLPEAIVIKSELPSTGTGKIDRRALASDAAAALSPAQESS
jgi:acyl-CoA synthetase (AMP-forming)/AMP-acid ligase II